MRSRHPIAAAIAAAALATAAGPAFGQSEGHSLSLTGPSSGTVGQPVTLQASGTVPPDAFLQRYVNVYAIPASVVSSCPATYQNAIAVKDGSSAQGGDTVAVVVPVEGSFSVPIVYSGRVPGRFLLCAYLHELSVTFAVATHQVTVAAAGGAPPPSGDGGSNGAPAKPAATRKPKVARAGGKLVCNRGRWSGSPTRYAYQWKVNGKRKRGASGRTLKITAKLRGKVVRCGVKATGPGGSTTVMSPSVRVR